MSLLNPTVPPALNPTPPRPLFDRLVLAGVLLLALVWMGPMLWVLALSFKPNALLMSRADVFLGPPYTVENFTDILQSSMVFRWLANSAIVALTQTVGVLVL